MDLQEADIQRILLSLYNKRNHYPCVTNFKLNSHECDFLSVTRSDYICEYEIKISRSDFLREFKDKETKHKWLMEGRSFDEHRPHKDKWYEENILIPNYFTFVVTESSGITEDMIPDYAGFTVIRDNEGNYDKPIIYLRRTRQRYVIDEIRKPKKLHTRKAELKFYKKLATVMSGRFIYGNKFYDYCKEHKYYG